MYSLYRRARRVLWPYDHTSSLDGPAQDEGFYAHVRALKDRLDAGRPPTMTQIDYFADRFRELEIQRHVECSFEKYLEHPLTVEQIRNDLADTKLFPNR